MLVVEEKKKVKEEVNNIKEDDNKEVALGICFGCGLGIVAGALMDNVLLGMSAGGALGIVIATIIKFVKKVKA